MPALIPTTANTPIGSNQNSEQDKILTDPQFTQTYNFSPRTTETWRRNGNGPPFLRIGRRVFYRLSDIEAWLATKRFKSRAHELSVKYLKSLNDSKNTERA
jgi:hypothetical protein